MAQWNSSNYPYITDPQLGDDLMVYDQTDSANHLLLLAYLMKQYSGTAFPTENLWDGMPFHRTNIGPGLTCFYDETNTQWLTHPYQFVGYRENASANGNYYYRIPNAGYAVWLPARNIATSTYVATTNTGAAYWTVNVYANDATSSTPVTLHTFTTAADSADTWTAHDDVPDDQSPASYDMFQVNWQKTGSPGNLYIAWGAEYQLIVT